jgi:steroid delta-isomerase
MSVQASVAAEIMPAAISQYFTAMRSLDVDAWVNTFAEDAISYEPVGTDAHQGKAAIRGFVEAITSLFQSVDVTVDFVHTVNTEVIVKWTVHGMGHNDRAVQCEGIDLFEINPSGKIQTLRGYWNPASLAAVQAG